MSMCMCFLFRDETKQEELWKVTFEMIGNYLTEDEIVGMKR